MKTQQQRNKKHDARSPRRSWFVAIALGVLMVTAAVFVYQRRSPAPPVVTVGSIDAQMLSLIESSRQAVIASPRSGSAWGKLGQAFHAAEFHVEAATCYSNAVRLNPDEARSHYLRGVVALQDSPDIALQYLARAVALVGNTNETPRYALGHALVERGQFDEARTHLELVLAANPRHAAAQLDLARVFSARNQLKEATLALQSPLTNNFTKRQALLLGAQVAQRNNQPDIAAQFSRAAAAAPRGPDWPDPFLREVQALHKNRTRLADRINDLLQQKRLSDADAAVSELLAAYPNDTEGELLLGRLRYQQGRCAESETVFRQHLEHHPNSLNGLVQLGLALICQERWSNAVPVLERAVSLKTDFAAGHHNLGVARSHTGDSAGAIRAFRDALVASPGDVNTLFALAEELANQGQLADAIDCVRRVEKVAPNDPRVAKARAQLGIK